MIANYEVVKDTYFGRLLGCCFGQLIKARLAQGESAELDMTAMDIGIKVNGVEMDLHKLFSVFEKSLSESPLGRPSGNPRVDSDIIEQLSDLADALERQQDNVSEACSDAITAASSSYYCGEYASEAASESGHEHHPGSECLEEEIRDLRGIIETLQESLSEAA